MSIIGEFSLRRLEVYFEWEISDFLQQVDGNSYFRSPEFTFLDCDWNLQIRPTGRQQDTGWISLFLVLRYSNDVHKTVTYTFGVKKSDGTLEEKEPRRQTFMFDFYSKWDPCEDSYRSAQFLNLDDLQKRKSELAPSDTLTITCRLENGLAKLVPQPSELTGLQTLSKNFNDLFTSKKKHDITVKVKDVEFPVHKAVLVARSPVFAAMFEHGTLEEKTGVVTVPDCDPDCFGEFLHYLYAGKFEGISFKNTYQLYITADKYDVQELKSSCVAYMSRNFTVENVFDVITLADQYHDAGLLSSAQEFFNLHFRKIFSMAKWEALVKSNFRLANKLLMEIPSPH